MGSVRENVIHLSVIAELEQGVFCKDCRQYRDNGHAGCVFKAPNNEECPKFLLWVQILNDLREAYDGYEDDTDNSVTDTNLQKLPKAFLL